MQVQNPKTTLAKRTRQVQRKCAEKGPEVCFLLLVNAPQGEIEERHPRCIVLMDRHQSYNIARLVKIAASLCASAVEELKGVEKKDRPSGQTVSSSEGECRRYYMVAAYWGAKSL